MEREIKVNLKGKISVVTGAGTGIGRSIAISLGKCGSEVFVHYNRSKDEAYRVVEEISKNTGKAIAVQADLTKEKEVRILFERINKHSKKLDILVNNAGGNIKLCKLTKMTEELWDNTIALNLKSFFLCCREAISMLPDNTGRIINISSISARTGGGPQGIAYAVAKAGVSNFTRGLAKELAYRRVTVNAIAPGVIRTKQHAIHTSKEEYEHLIQKIPLGRDGFPEDITGAVLFLVSDSASFITGETIEINGGMLMD